MDITIYPIAALPGRPGDVASISGDMVTHNGRTFDLSSVPEGGRATPEGDHPFAGPITRTGGDLSLALRMAYDTATAEPAQPSDPAHWRVEMNSGEVPDLVVRKPVPEVEAAE